MSTDCVISTATGETKLVITNTKLYIAAVTLYIQDNTNLLQKLKSGFKHTTNWNKYSMTNSNKYQLKVTTQPRKQYFSVIN